MFENDKQNLKYHLKQDIPFYFQDLKVIFSYLYHAQDNSDIKLGLNIILNLLSHKKRVQAIALGKLFLFIEDSYIRHLIICKLRKLALSEDCSVRIFAEYSLQVIASEIFNLPVLDDFFKYLDKISSLLQSEFVQFNSQISLYLDIVYDWIDDISFLSKINETVTRRCRIFHRYLDRISFSIPGLQEMIPYDDEFSTEVIIEFIHQPVIPFSSFEELESPDEDPFSILANIYSYSFREKGHLSRLEAMLNDDDPLIQYTAVCALSSIVQALLTNSKQEYATQKFPNSYLDKINNNLALKING